jgi:hypothetical protein
MAMQSTILPPDGTILRVSQWRRQSGWIPTAIFAFLAIGTLIEVVQESHPVSALVGPLGLGLVALGFARMSLSGVILESQGVKARTVWRTYHWTWDEIERFELRDRGEVPRFQIQLRDGTTRGFLGFFARSPAQEAKGQALFEALRNRLETEHAKSAR